MDLTKIVPWVFLKCCKKPESSDPDSQAEQEDDKTDRATWSNKTEYLLSMVGYAVGLGNIWRFPYLTYKNGGGAFLIPYLIMMIFTGLPLYLLESALGQFASLGPVLVWRSVPFFQGVGITMVIGQKEFAAHIKQVSFWGTAYCLCHSSQGLIKGICNVTSGSNSTDAMNLTWVEANNETCINNRTALDNVTLLSKEYWDKVVLHRSSGLDETGVILNKIIRQGFAIFSILGHMAHELNRPVSEVVDSGFSLAFIAYPEALTTLPVSPLWSILFFLMLLTLGFDTQFSTLETLTTAIQDAIPDLMKRFRVLITIGCCTVLFLLGLPCVTQWNITYGAKVLSGVFTMMANLG
ncbi:hypothetical protein NDU88_002364 [Pleurodeles waltl]|uniref:Transporter n=1 Tax=Pleurodeles waltl TaxID=8319 RepID=A0AAV7VD10_PLEWA|nr:hypothetical protein NDU88_002364 [Pleurodeles waltl]